MWHLEINMWMSSNSSSNCTRKPFLLCPFPKGGAYPDLWDDVFLPR